MALITPRSTSSAMTGGFASAPAELTFMANAGLDEVALKAAIAKAREAAAIANAVEPRASVQE